MEEIMKANEKKKSSKITLKHHQKHRDLTKQEKNEMRKSIQTK